MPSFHGSVRNASDSGDGRDCWSKPDPAGFSLRSASYPFDGSMVRVCVCKQPRKFLHDFIVLHFLTSSKMRRSEINEKIRYTKSCW